MSSLRDEAAKWVARLGPSASLFLREGETLSLEAEPSGGGVEARVAEVIAEARLDEGGSSAAARGRVHGPEDVEALFAAARARLACESAVSVDGPAHAETSRPALPELSPDRARVTAAHLAKALLGRGHIVQALLHKQSAQRVTVIRGGEVREERREQEQLLVRCESSGGAFVEGLASNVLAPNDWDVLGLANRISAALQSLEAKATAAPEALPVLVRPPVAAPLIGGLAWLLSGDVARSAPAFLKAMGQRAFPACLTVLDRSQGPLARRTFDDEGTTCADVQLIDQGIVRALLHTRATAAALSHAPTGRATLAEDEGVRPQPLNLQLLPSAFTLPERYLELDARAETFTTLTRPGHVGLIASGWLHDRGDRRALGTLELEAPIFQTFRKLAGVGDEARWFPSADGTVAPSLYFSNLSGLAAPR